MSTTDAAFWAALALAVAIGIGSTIGAACCLLHILESF